MPLTLGTIPGYSDLATSILAAGQPTRGIHLEEISANAAFAMCRLEVFQVMHWDTDQVLLPISPIDGYSYDITEIIYAYTVSSTGAKTTGWESSTGCLFFCDWDVDQATGKVFSQEFYRMPGDLQHLADTRDGWIFVWLVCQRQRTNLIMSTTASYSAVTLADIATDKPWHQGLAQALDVNAKFACVNKEIFYCGEFTDGQTVPHPISRADGYTYAYTECKFLATWRWTSISSAFTQPPSADGVIGPMLLSVSSSGVVSCQVYMCPDGIDASTLVSGFGRCAVFAFCTRVGTPGSTPLANSFQEVDPTIFMPGTSLRASTVLAIKKNIDEAVLTPEFFGPTVYADGDTIALPVSPVDGYTYNRNECIYVWSWADTSNTTGTHVRAVNFWGGITQSTGHVTMNASRMGGFPTGNIVDDNNTLLRMTVIIVARRQQSNPAVIDTSAVGNGPGGISTSTVANTGPYAITFDMGGGRTTPPATSESLLRHVIADNLTSVALASGLPTSVAKCRTTSTGTYTITINKIIGGVTTAIGTITFSAGNATAAFTFSSTVTLSPGDTVELVSGTADATILGIYITLSGLRTS